MVTLTLIALAWVIWLTSPHHKWAWILTLASQDSCFNETNQC